jgi:sec-independent protein translocase protein TatA
MRTDIMGNLFDSPWKVLVVAIVLIVLFGSKKLPDAARSLGKSMRILKTEVSDLHHDESDPAPAAKPETGFPPAQLTAAPAPAPADQQGQIDALQQQVRDLQRASAMDTPANVGAAAEPQRTQPS